MASIKTTTRSNVVENIQIMTEKLQKSNPNIQEAINFGLFDIFCIIFSLLFILIDCCTDLFLVIEYYQLGYITWAIATFILILLPSIIVQTFSLRWYMADNDVSSLHWILHFCSLGLLYRYFSALQLTLDAKQMKEKSDYQKLYAALSDLSLLHLFESFLESAPQLVLQLYIIATLQQLRFFTGLSAAASILSLSLALVSYSRSQRRARVGKSENGLIGLILQAVWRLGMLTARICALVLLLLYFQSWFLLFISVHWLSMLVWIVYQDTDLCDTPWEERCYNAVAAVIYCFCFFNLKEGRSRWRVLAYYALTVVQNLASVTVFLMWYAEKTPRLGIVAFVAIVGGTLIGSIAMVLYYRWFHPAGPLYICGEETENQPSNHVVRSLKHPGRGVLPRYQVESHASSPQSGTNLTLSDSKLVLSDSVVIIEESDMEEINTLQSWIKEAVTEEQVKRRGVCSPLELDEVSSSALSAHDYENMAAINIARATGLRHWRCYNDIEKYLHDDSVVRDTLTSTTASSSQDYLDSIAEDYIECKLSNDPVGMFAPSSLDTILEEVEVLDNKALYIIKETYQMLS